MNDEKLQIVNEVVMPVTKDQLQAIIEISMEFGARKVLLFGGALNNPSTAKDIDIGVLGVPSDKFLLFAGTIENRIRKNVDVVPLEIDSDFVRHVKSKGKYIYES